MGQARQDSLCDPGLECSCREGVLAAESDQDKTAKLIHTLLLRDLLKDVWEEHQYKECRANDFPFQKNAFSVSHLVNSVFFSVSAHFVHPEVD